MKNIVRNVKENTRNYVYRVLKENIMYLELIPGQVVSEIEIAEKLDVSRTPVREALVKLSDEKLVDVYPQRGTIVAKISLSDVEEAFYTRKVLEKEILKLAASLAKEASLKELEKNIYLQKGLVELGGETIERFHLDNLFHKIIYEMAGKARTWDAVKYVSTHYDRLRYLDAMEGIVKNTTLEQHIEIYEAIKNKDYSKIESIVDEHLGNYKKEMKIFKKKYPDYFVD